jgi:hypothetical protein
VGAVLEFQKTIQFCGDSFCDCEEGYLSTLSKLLDAKIVTKGKQGSSQEHAIITFNPNVDYTVFCWTEEHRIYHSQHDDLNMAVCETRKDTSEYHLIGSLYYEKLHDFQWAERRAYRDLYWFDKEVLSKSKSKIIHCFGFKNRFKFIHGYTLSKPISTIFNTQKNYVTKKKVFNHMDECENNLFAQLLFDIFTKELLSG